jgi:dihydroxyacetone synthase
MSEVITQSLKNGHAPDKGVTLLKNVQANGINGSGLPKVEGWRQTLNDDDRAVLALRNLIFDICNHNGGGHGGSAIGMAAIGVALYKHIMRYNPLDPNWFDRDWFVLSNGNEHTS